MRGLLGLIGLWGLRGLWSLRGLWAEEDKGAAIYLMLDGLGHHGNRLYGFMGLPSKQSEWNGLDGMDGYPLDDY